MENTKELREAIRCEVGTYRDLDVEKKSESFNKGDLADLEVKHELQTNVIVLNSVYIVFSVHSVCISYLSLMYI